MSLFNIKKNVFEDYSNRPYSSNNTTKLYEKDHPYIKKGILDPLKFVIYELPVYLPFHLLQFLFSSIPFALFIRGKQLLSILISSKNPEDSTLFSDEERNQPESNHIIHPIQSILNFPANLYKFTAIVFFRILIWRLFVHSAITATVEVLDFLWSIAGKPLLEWIIPSKNNQHTPLVQKKSTEVNGKTWGIKLDDVIIKALYVLGKICGLLFALGCGIGTFGCLLEAFPAITTHTTLLAIILPLSFRCVFYINKHISWNNVPNMFVRFRYDTLYYSEDERAEAVKLFGKMAWKKMTEEEKGNLSGKNENEKIRILGENIFGKRDEKEDEDLKGNKTYYYSISGWQKVFFYSSTTFIFSASIVMAALCWHTTIDTLTIMTSLFGIGGGTTILFPFLAALVVGGTFCTLAMIISQQIAQLIKERADLKAWKTVKELCNFTSIWKDSSSSISTRCWQTFTKCTKLVVTLSLFLFASFGALMTMQASKKDLDGLFKNISKIPKEIGNIMVWGLIGISAVIESLFLMRPTARLRDTVLSIKETGSEIKDHINSALFNHDIVRETKTQPSISPRQARNKILHTIARTINACLNGMISLCGIMQEGFFNIRYKDCTPDQKRTLKAVAALTAASNSFAVARIGDQEEKPKTNLDHSICPFLQTPSSSEKTQPSEESNLPVARI